MTTELQTVETNEAIPKRRAKRRGNGEGSVYAVAGRNLYAAKVSLGYDANGKRVRQTIYAPTKAQLQDKVTRLKTQKLDGTLCEPSRLTVATYLERWLSDVAKPGVRQSTHVRYSELVKLHINPRIGGVPLAKLTPLHVRGVYTDMARVGLSPRMRQFTHAVLRKALSDAALDGTIPRNVCDAVRPPKVTKAEMKVLTPEQASLFIATSETDRLHALYVLAITTGLRQGELYGLQPGDVDLEAGCLSVRRTLTEIDGQFSTGEPKTAKGRRRVELPAIAVEALHEHRKRMMIEGNAKSAWIFCDANGGPLRRQNVMRRSFRPILQAAGLPVIRFHDLRHTAATLLLSEGVHPKVVQERLGHANIALTLDVYSHVLPSMQKEAAGKLDRMFAKAATG